MASFITVYPSHSPCSGLLGVELRPTQREVTGAPCSQGLCPRAWISVGGQHGKLRDWEADIQF